MLADMEMKKQPWIKDNQNSDWLLISDDQSYTVKF